MNISKDEFIKQVASAMIELYPKYKILPSLGIAQAIKESNYGKSDCNNSFNFFGMKANKTDKNFIELSTKEWNGKEYITIKAKFLVFHSFTEGMEGYCKFIHKYKRYSNIIGETDALKCCDLIKTDGWATSPTYASGLKTLISQYNLTQYDSLAILGYPLPVEEIKQPDDDYLFIKVKPGDTLWSISRTYTGFGTKWKDIYNLNNLKSTTIIPGMVLKVPRRK